MSLGYILVYILYMFFFFLFFLSPDIQTRQLPAAALISSRRSPLLPRGVTPLPSTPALSARCSENMENNLLTTHPEICIPPPSFFLARLPAAASQARLANDRPVQNFVYRLYHMNPSGVETQKKRRKLSIVPSECQFPEGPLQTEGDP